MEMVKNELIVAIFLFCLASCGTRLDWHCYEMDGHRTGVVAPNASNQQEALGVIDDSLYCAPNGKEFSPETSTYQAAKQMIEVQGQMAQVKTVLASSAAELSSDEPNGALAYWTVDRIAWATGQITGRKIDVAITNIGGIRVDMPKGDVILDDILSMFPFKNYLCYVAIKGKNLLSAFEYMATKPQPISGAKVVYEQSKLKSLEIAGKPIDTQRVYGLATIDFLLDGGDGLYLGRNAVEIIKTDALIIDTILPYVQSYAESGQVIEYIVDDRMQIL